MFFLDTNVLVYTRDTSSPDKAARAASVIEELTAIEEAAVSTQVLAEYLWVVTRRLPQPLTLIAAINEVQRFQRLFTVVSSSIDIFNLALDLMATHQMTIWDAQIAAAASSCGASVLLTEDAQSQPIIHGVSYANPFADDFDWRDFAS